MTVDTRAHGIEVLRRQMSTSSLVPLTGVAQIFVVAAPILRTASQSSSPISEWGNMMRDLTLSNPSAAALAGLLGSVRYLQMTSKPHIQMVLALVSIAWSRACKRSRLLHELPLEAARLDRPSLLSASLRPKSPASLSQPSRNRSLILPSQSFCGRISAEASAQVCARG